MRAAACFLCRSQDRLSRAVSDYHCITTEYFLWCFRCCYSFTTAHRPRRAVEDAGPYREGEGKASSSPTELRISWNAVLGSITPEHAAEHPPVAVQVAIRSRGGEASVKPQLHRVRAIFDTWRKAHPDFSPRDIQW